MTYRAFEHSNGNWYVSAVDDSGTHHQPMFASMSETEARRAAKRRNAEPQETTRMVCDMDTRTDKCRYYRVPREQY